MQAEFDKYEESLATELETEHEFDKYEESLVDLLKYINAIFAQNKKFANHLEKVKKDRKDSK